MNYLGSIDTRLIGIAKVKSPIMRLSPKCIVVLGGIPKKKKLTLKEIIFNSSGNFIVPPSIIENKFYIGCTGGGGGGSSLSNIGGGGSGRTIGMFQLTVGLSIPITIGNGGIGGSSPTDGGISSFGTFLNCAGGLSTGTGVNGGGDGGSGSGGTSSYCPDIFKLRLGAIDNTTQLYTVKSYRGGINNGGGAGCYGIGADSNTNGAPNTGSGGDGGYYKNGGSGKVVIYYYVYE